MCQSYDSGHSHGLELSIMRQSCSGPMAQDVVMSWSYDSNAARVWSHHLGSTHGLKQSPRTQVSVLHRLSSINCYDLFRNRVKELTVAFFLNPLFFFLLDSLPPKAREPTLLLSVQLDGENEMDLCLSQARYCESESNKLGQHSTSARQFSFIPQKRLHHSQRLSERFLS